MIKYKLARVFARSLRENKAEVVRHMSGKSTISEQIYKILYDDIIYQRIPCGKKLTLKILKERFEVSHTPIREALTRLAENGLVKYYSNCGVTVSVFGEQDIREIYKMTGELDSMAIRFCKDEGLLEPLLAELGEVIASGNEYIERGDYLGWKRFSEEFHFSFYHYANNRYLDEIVGSLRAKMELLSWMYYTEPNMESIHRQHVAIYETLKTGDYDKAAEMMKDHLKSDLEYALAAYNSKEQK